MTKNPGPNSSVTVGTKGTAPRIARARRATWSIADHSVDLRAKATADFGKGLRAVVGCCLVTRAPNKPHHLVRKLVAPCGARY